MTKASDVSATTPSNSQDALGRNCRNKPKPESSLAISLVGSGSSYRPLSRRPLSLERQAKEFAGSLSELLDGTVTDGVRLRSNMDRHGRAVIGYKLDEFNSIGGGIPLTISQSPPRFCLSVLHTLELDDTNTFLTTSQSTYSLQRDADGTSILTYDFVRKPPNDFPEAHIHVHGESDVLNWMLKASGRPKDKPTDLHLPVGPRRFRPCLEDIIEFCILERLVTPRDNWQTALAKSRDKYLGQQLLAAVRRDPYTAAEALKRDGWRVTEPKV